MDAMQAPTIIVQHLKVVLAFRKYVQQQNLNEHYYTGLGGGEICRDSDGLTLSYTTGNGETVSLLLSEDGYVDPDKMRRPTAYDFRGIADGVLRETVDGNVIVSYAVEKDALGRITRLTTADGHETAIRW